MTQYQNTFFTPGRKNGHVVYEWKFKPGAERAIQQRISDIAVIVGRQKHLYNEVA
ncbi:hypothetical protein [Paenibacillus sp. OV219]|uniref:hypothetical protein n=1 Tax=Paenibacillus sp. OV219 TaxID=1884377 RepID=UPI0015A54A3A|nr:hypothetical protein [Paenibacillus sp. OV219]